MEVIPSVEEGERLIPADGEAAAPVKAGMPQASRDALLIGAGWVGTGLAMSMAELPFKFLLKDRLHLDADATAGFMAIVNIPIYIKPLAGMLSDSLPIFGTRRRHYLILSLLIGGLLWGVLGIVPRSFQSLLITYLALNAVLVMTSTVLGGLMVEVGKRDGTTGKLSAQRLGIVRIVGLVGGPLGGFMVKQAFVITTLMAGALHLALVPVFWMFLREPRAHQAPGEALREIGRQARALFASRTLWSAAGLVVLVIAAPGFTTPLLYHQTNVLKFTPQFIGLLHAITAVFGMLAALLYSFICRRFNLRTLLALSIVVHAGLTLLYLFYRTPESAMVITAIEAMTLVFALLPLYDLAARATPHGSEALGYSLMMSVWNFTFNMSDVAGSKLYSKFGLTFNELIWVNAGTTALVLIAVPFLPAVLMNRRDGDPDPSVSH